MQNRFLNERTAKDIDGRIEKLLKDLDDPEPPLRLEQVRELLRLDLAFYSSSNTGVLAETIHRLKVAGKHVIERPSLLFEAVRRWELKALWVPDRKRILIDSELPSSKQRWGEAHEIGHSILPWHDMVMHGDRKRTLSLACEEEVESEANFAAGRLLFLRERFVEELQSSDLNFDAVKALAKVFGNTMTSTLWRAVESSHETVFGMVSQHPGLTFGEEPIRYFVRSQSFAEQFPNVTAMQIFRLLSKFCFGSRGPIGSAEVQIVDLAGAHHIFFVEVFFNTHEALTLGVFRKSRNKSVSVL